MRIAVIGAGIAGLTTARLLADEHEVTLFEAGSYPGGHTNTICLEHAGKPYALDTGFMVFNDRTYPNFIRLLDLLGVDSQPSDMSFSVKNEATGLEYCGSSLNTLFAQRWNLVRPAFYRMLRDILRFNRDAAGQLADADDRLTLGEFLRREHFGEEFVSQYLVPMGAAIWSAPPAQMHQFPARYFVRFFANHGLLSINDRPQWRVIRGGAYRYVEQLVRPLANRLRLNCPIASISRFADHVHVKTGSGTIEEFDEVVVATHADQALRLLADPSDLELDVLGAFAFQKNVAVLHTDASVLPRSRLAWASWNYHVVPNPRGEVAVTYLLNRLQSLDAPEAFCVTLNHTSAIDAARVLRRIVYHHPVYTPGAVAAQSRHAEISGVRRTHYCGAYWGYGFHEDGVNSALTVARHFGCGLDSLSPRRPSLATSP